MKKSSLIIILASLSLSTLLTGCGDNAPELNNYNCTPEGLNAYKSQKNTDKESFIQFQEQCQFKDLGGFSDEWKKTVGKKELKCALIFDKVSTDKCLAELKQLRDDLTAKYKAESDK